MVPKNKKSSYVDEAMWRFVHVHCAHRWNTVGQVEHPSPQTPILSLWGRYSNSLFLAFFFKYQLKFVLS